MEKADKITYENKLDEKQNVYDNYGFIEIPKINLYKKFTNDSKIDRGIIMISPSEYPNINNSVLILAGHSGSGPYAFFNYLYKLKIFDEIIIKYMDFSYHYKIIDISYHKKTGVLKIYKKKNQNTLILITCTNNNKYTQTVYTAVKNI